MRQLRERKDSEEIDSSKINRRLAVIPQTSIVGQTKYRLEVQIEGL